MRRLVLIATAAAAAALLVASLANGGDSSTGDYLVRAYFDNGGFIVSGEDVRVAGATVGAIREVDVSRPGERVSLEPGGNQMPAKAVAVLEITNPAFADFRADATCIIRPQSLLGEKFVDCLTTQPRAAGTDPPPPLRVIEAGQIGAGQRLLALEQNGKAVDLDLVQNIMRQPEADRLRIILNDLGAGLAARGDDLAVIIERANPALRETDRVLAILAARNHRLARLAVDSDRALGPLARGRAHLSGLIEGAAATAAAAAEHRDEIAAGFARLPRFLNQLRLTSRQLRRFSLRGIPLATNFRAEAAPLAAATRRLGPFADVSSTALRSLGGAAAASGPDLVASNPVLRDLRRLGAVSDGGARALARALASLHRSGGFAQLGRFIYNTAGSVNGFDSQGHYLRGFGLVTNCADYLAAPLSGCIADWQGLANETAAPLRAERSGPPRGPDRAAAEAAVDDLLGYLRENDSGDPEAPTGPGGSKGPPASTASPNSGGRGDSSADPAPGKDRTGGPAPEVGR